MKTTIAALVLVFSVTVQAQNFVRYTLKDWVLEYSQTNSSYIENIYTNTLSFTVPTNTIFKATILCETATPYLEAQYPDANTRVYVGAAMADSRTGQTPVIGPATIYLTGNLYTYDGTSNGTLILLAEFDAVNTSPAIQGFAVQPANSSAQIGLETSTDLKSWQTTTNGIYGLTNYARFFRMNLTVTP
jgi:hypothetical protein